jgi:hypothetical protein
LRDSDSSHVLGGASDAGQNDRRLGRKIFYCPALPVQKFFAKAMVHK